MNLNFDYLKFKIWEYLALIVVYTKKRGGNFSTTIMPDFTTESDLLFIYSN